MLGLAKTRVFRAMNGVDMVMVATMVIVLMTEEKAAIDDCLSHLCRYDVLLLVL